MIELNNISFGYNMPIFNKASFKAKEGTITLIQGESGIGKSTLLDIIHGKKGKCWESYIFNNLEADNVSMIKQHVLYLRQNDELFINDTVKDNINIFATYFDKKLSNNDIVELLNKVHLPFEKINIKLKKLSSGERQRVQLALAILGDYPIILLDEITNALDNDNKAIVLDIVKKMACDLNKTIIVVSHDNEFSNIADKIYSINDEKLVVIKDDNNEEVKTRVFYQLGTPKLFYSNYLKTKFRNNKFNYLAYFCTLIIVTTITVFGIQYGNQYSQQLSFLKDTTQKNQLYLTNQGVDVEIVDPYYQESLMPIEKNVVDYLKQQEIVLDAKENYAFPVIDLNNGSSGQTVTFDIFDGTNRTETIYSHSISTFLYSYYAIEDLKDKCEIFVDNEADGIFITNSMANVLKIENIDEYSTISLIVYVPKTSVDSFGMTSTKSNGSVETTYKDITYEVVKIKVPIIGILKKEHTSLSNSMGYLNNQFMEQLVFEVQDDVIIEGEEELWTSNLYTVFIRNEDTDELLNNLYDFNSNYALFSTLNSYTLNLFEDYIEIENTVKLYVLILLTATILLTTLYSIFVQRKYKAEWSNLRFHFLKRKQVIKLFNRELTMLILILGSCSLILINLVIFICLKQNILITTESLTTNILRMNLLQIIIIIVLVILSQCTTYFMIRKDRYD